MLLFFSCGCLDTTVQLSQFKKLPKILAITLKRFDESGVKLSKSLEIPDLLYITDKSGVRSV